MRKPISATLKFLFRLGFLFTSAIVLLLTSFSGIGQTPYFFFTLAGKAGSSGFTNLPGPDARFNAPSGVALDSMDNVYVADTANHIIREITPTATVSTVAGVAGSSGSSNGPVASAQFNSPTGLSLDASGTVFVADWGNHLIRKISNGQVTTVAGLAGKPGWADGSNLVAQFNHPASLAVDSLGQIFIADQGNHAIRVVAQDGSIVTLAGSPGVAGSADGIGTNAQFNLPSGIAIGNNALFVADTGNDTIREITVSGSDWVVTTLAGSPGLTGTNDLVGAAARFNTPTSVSVAGGGGYVFVTDFGNDTLRVVSLTGVTATLAGSPTTSGAAGGAQFMTLLNWPAGAALDSLNNVFVADRGNNVIVEGSPVTGPDIIVQPESQTSVPDGSATFSVVAIGVAPLTYQWKLDNQDLPNAVTSSVEIDDLEPGDGGKITVEVTSPYGSVTSTNVDLIVAEPGSFITWAGTAGKAGAEDGDGGDSLFNYPGAVATDTNGNIFVADSGNHTIRELIPSGLTDCKVKTLAGSAGNAAFADGAGTNALFDTPYGIWVETNGTVLVADSFNYVVRQMQFDGTNWNVTTLAGRLGASGTNDGVGTNGLFGQPVGMVVGLGGNIYVADYENHELRQVTPNGEITTMYGPGLINGGQSNAPLNWVYGLGSTAGLTVDAAGNLFVADDDNNQIFEVSTNDSVYKWKSVNYAGMQSAYGGTNDGSQYDARFNEPEDVAGDGNGNYYVADGGNDTIRKIAADQSVSTIGGVPGKAGSSDGSGTNAMFDTPYGLVVDPNGLLYVADTGNNTIRKYLPDPLIAVQPQPQTVPVNSNATFNVVAASTTNLMYQWLKNGKPISSGNDSSLAISGAQAGDVGSYSVVVSTEMMVITSSVAKLTVQTPPIITSGPVSQIVSNGAKVTFGCAVIGTGPLTYQWMLNGAPLPGQTKTNVIIAHASTNDLGDYALAVNGPVANIISSNAILAFVPPTMGIVSWSSPVSITYGEALTTNQLDATSKVPGKFAYSLTNGTVLDAGTNALTVVFTPNDMVDYSSATDTVSLVVAPAPLTVTAASVSRQFGQPNPVFTGTIIGLTNGDNVTATYSCSATTGSPPGLYSISPMLIDPKNRLGNYDVTLSNGTLTVIGGLIRAVARSGGSFSFSWPMTTGESYQIETTTNLSSGVWIDVGDPIVGSDSIETLTIPILDVVEYFRVIPSP